MANVFANEDTLSFSVAQPLRIEAGAMDMQLPTGRDSNGTIEQRQVAADLEPAGRELDLGLGYQMPVGSGRLQLGLQYRLDSGHVQGAWALQWASSRRSEQRALPS